MKNNIPSILVVDDRKLNIEVIYDILEGTEYKLLSATNGKDAIDIINKEELDLVLLDLIMPDMDGFEVCRIIKSDQKNEDLPIIFITARTDIDSISKAFAVGGIDYITKPFNHEELLIRVDNHLELQRKNDIIKQKNRSLKELNKTKDKFFSIIAHDLRNPFNNIFQMVTMMNSQYSEMSEEDLARSVELLYQSAKQGNELLENLLEWSRSQRNKMPFNPKNENLHPIVTSTINVLLSTASAKNIDLVNLVKPNDMAKVDKNMFATIIRNLISNAIKFTPHGGKVTIATLVKPDWVKITVQDTGIGISKEKINTLFDLGVNNSTRGTDNEKGTGLGLNLCKEFIDKHKGHVMVTSEENQGTKFIFTLPAINNPIELG
jgi:signal transduction histidine kinase